MTDRNTKIRGTQIFDDTIPPSKMKALNSPVDNYILDYDSASQEFNWVPKLGAITETPSGDVNGSNKNFTLSNDPESGSLSVYLNGLYQEEGSGKDYILSGTQITFLNAPITDDVIIVSYDTDSGAGGAGAENLEELTDVDFDSGTPTDNQILTYDAGTSKWKAEDATSTSYQTTFVDGDLDSNQLITITHNLDVSYPLVVVYDNNDKIIQPDEIEYKTTNSIQLDMSSLAPLTGTYKIRVIG